MHFNINKTNRQETSPLTLCVGLFLTKFQWLGPSFKRFRKVYPKIKHALLVLFRFCFLQ